MANEKDRWQEITVARPPEATDIKLLNIIGSVGISYFDQPAYHFVHPKEIAELEVLPNTFYENLKISADVIIHSIEITDMQGKLILSYLIEYTNMIEISTIHLKQGMYLLKVVTQKGILIRKIIK